jgi:hypothetical protein
MFSGCSWICEADVELFVQEESENPAICGRCTTFICMANDTNIVEILQNDTLCQTFERDNKFQGPDECNNLELALINATVDPNNKFLTIFVIEGKQCFQGERNAINIKCADATMNSKSLQLGVDSGTCSQNVMCHKENCSECIEEGFEIEWSFLQCPGFETVTNYSLSISPGEENITISDERYCKCETEQQFEIYTIKISGVNQCGETTVISSTCENGINT